VGVGMLCMPREWPASTQLDASASLLVRGGCPIVETTGNVCVCVCVCVMGGDGWRSAEGGEGAGCVSVGGRTVALQNHQSTLMQLPRKHQAEAGSYTGLPCDNRCRRL
jgi:hypothetical protein